MSESMFLLPLVEMILCIHVSFTCSMLMKLNFLIFNRKYDLQSIMCVMSSILCHVEQLSQICTLLIKQPSQEGVMLEVDLSKVLFSVKPHLS